MKLIVGLGNPGKEFEKTRHNAGFLAVEKIISNIQSPIIVENKHPISVQNKFNAEIFNATINGKKIILAKPQTFMNSSGAVVKAVMDYYKISAQDIIVIHDDLDIPLGEYKISKNRGSAGHKGVQSVIDSLGTKDFMRIRLGIEVKKIPDSRFQTCPREASGIPNSKDFVLEKFSKEEMEALEKIIAQVAEEIVKLLNC